MIHHGYFTGQYQRKYDLQQIFPTRRVEHNNRMSSFLSALEREFCMTVFHDCQSRRFLPLLNKYIFLKFSLICRKIAIRYKGFLWIVTIERCYFTES